MRFEGALIGNYGRQLRNDGKQNTAAGVQFVAGAISGAFKV